MSLVDWERAGILVKHAPSRPEIMDLLAIVARDLRECRLSGLSPEWRLSIAYNAILQAANAALAAVGYRVRRREGGHYYALESLAHTVGVKSDVLRMLHILRKKRHLSDYVRVGAVSRGEADEAVALAERISEEVKAWLQRHRPELI